MVGAGNTGATMAAALLRFGRIKGVHRPAIAVPLPVFGQDRMQLLVDGGATVDPEPAWLVEWAELARAYARVRLGVAEPTIALLSNGEEPGKGDELRKRASELLADVKGFVGNVEGRDVSRGGADVILTDGFTGNVTLKTLEGAVMGLAGMVFGVVDEPGTPWADAADALKLRLLEAAAPLLPDNTGGAMLLGLEGVCIISHGSSSPDAIVNAVRVARDCVRADVVAKLREAAGAPGESGGRGAR
jgi:glycerol-3-phosphate acyltransferase PlsX